jgi:hypothetical protein
MRKNGQTPKIALKPTPKQRQTFKARKRILRAVKKYGFITNEKARKVGRFDQAWYHLNRMVELKVLQRSGHNEWTLAKRRQGEPNYIRRLQRHF